MEPRIAHVHRVTKETDIELTLNLDGTGKSEISTGIGFFDHMLDGFTRHGLFDVKLTAKGDLHVDSHHTIEDTGIVLGSAIAQAVGDKAGIRRYGSFILPMDETLLLCAIDLSGRPYFSCDTTFTAPMVGDMQTEMVSDFFYAVSYSAAMNLHIKQLSGVNNHHIIEAAFKAFAKSLDMATGYDSRIEGVWSTKGTL
ncbi:MAG: imidazoleglycerol-phosphate dehydratase HisB [Lachnospiraceae bacterium]|nr:imidazoleglycerol-phosphate dehydratase HisB [Lachnospiraceae bacterium]